MGPARHRREEHQPLRLLRLGLAAVKGAALGGLFTLVVVGGPHLTAPSAQPGATAEHDADQRVVDRAVAEHHCSYAGFGHDVLPSAALIRTPQGALREVSFAVGWDVYTGQRPGTLIAVCLEEPQARGLVQVSS